MADQQTAPPPAVNPPVGAVLTAVAAPDAAASLAAMMAAIGLTALTGAAGLAATKALIAGFVGIERKRFLDGTDFVMQELQRQYPNEPVAELVKLTAQEAQYEQEFRTKMQARLQRDLPGALATDDPTARMAAVQDIIEREKRFTLAREDAMFMRALGAAEVVALKKISPQGAYWKLSPNVAEHTPDCLAMGDKFWPWEALEDFTPPVHHGCACSLLGHNEAIDAGLMKPDDPIPTTAAAIAKARQARKDAADMQEAAEPSTGAMVALYPTPEAARALADAGGNEPVDELHLTLAFLGDASAITDPAQLQAVVKGFAASCAPLSGEVSGTGFFTAGPEKVVYASADVPGLPALRERLVDALKGAGAPASETHGFTPHITLAYGEDQSISAPAGLKLEFSAVTLKLGDRRYDFAMDGALQEAEVRWPKGDHRGGEFRGGGASEWQWLGGRQVQVPHGEWRRQIGGRWYSSPHGSTRVFRNGKLVDEHIERHETPLPTRRPALPGQAASAVAGIRAEIRGRKPRAQPAAVVAPEGHGLGRAPHNLPEFLNDTHAWAHDLADQHGAELRLGNVRVDPSEPDHAGLRSWNGDTALGSDVEHDIESAGAARAAGIPLTDDQKRGVWSSYRVAAHEVAHGLNPMAPADYQDDTNADIEEALAEEQAHALAVDRLHATGQDDVVAWHNANPDSLDVQGVYRRQRAALGSLFDEGDVDDRRGLLDELKFRVDPAQRTSILAGISGTDEQHVRDVMDNHTSAGPILASPPVDGDFYNPPPVDDHMSLEQLLKLSPTERGTWDDVRKDYEENHPQVMAALRDDLAKRGVRTPLIVDRERGKVLAGHHRLLAGQDAGVTHFPVHYSNTVEPERYDWDPVTREHVPYEEESPPVPDDPQTSETVNATPYYKDDDPHAPRSYEQAKAMRDDPKWRERFKAFEADLHATAQAHGVQIEVTPIVGVFEGEYEPSYEIKATGDPQAAQDMAIEIGKRWHQDSVAIFTPTKQGPGAEFAFHGIKDPDGAYQALHNAGEMGASLAGDTVTVLALDGDGLDEKTARLKKFAQDWGAKVSVRHGKVDFPETGGGGVGIIEARELRNRLGRWVDSPDAVKPMDLSPHLPGGPGSAVPSGTPGDVPPEKAVENVRKAIERAKARRTPEEQAFDSTFYDRKRAELTAYGEQYKLDPSKVIGAAAAFSPGTNPENDSKILDWLRQVPADEDPGKPNNPGIGVGYGYKSFIQAHDVLTGKADPHVMMPRNIKRGEYLRSIEGDPTAWTIDVHNWRDMVGAPDRDALSLGGLSPIQYGKYHDAMQKAGIGPTEQALIWGDRRREGEARVNTGFPEVEVDVSPVQEGASSYEDAMAAIGSDLFKEKSKAFRKSVREQARHFGVRALVEPDVVAAGGAFTPAFNLEVTGDLKNIAAFDGALTHGGHPPKGFWPDSTGDESEVRFKTIKNHQAFFEDVIKALGPDANIVYEADGSARVFVGDDLAKAKAVAKLGKQYGRGSVRRGRTQEAHVVHEAAQQSLAEQVDAILSAAFDRSDDQSVLLSLPADLTGDPLGDDSISEAYNPELHPRGRGGKFVHAPSTLADDIRSGRRTIGELSPDERQRLTQEVQRLHPPKVHEKTVVQPRKVDDLQAKADAEYESLVRDTQTKVDALKRDYGIPTYGPDLSKKPMGELDEDGVLYQPTNEERLHWEGDAAQVVHDALDRYPVLRPTSTQGGKKLGVLSFLTNDDAPAAEMLRDVPPGVVAAVANVPLWPASIMYVNDSTGPKMPSADGGGLSAASGSGRAGSLWHEVGHLLAQQYLDPNDDYATNDGAIDLLTRFGVSFSDMAAISDYSASSPYEAIGELSAMYHTPGYAEQLTPELRESARQMFSFLGGDIAPSGANVVDSTKGVVHA